MTTILTKAKQNWKAGLTVSLIAMPLSISLAVAAGSTPLIGIITAIWAGLVASIFGGSNYNIVGPTGALSGLIATYAVTHGTSGLPMLTIVSGILILIAYIFRLERYLIFIPSSVIHGFTLGVALVIGFNQFNAALGLYGLAKHENFFSNVLESFAHIAQTSIPSLIIFVIFLLLLLLLRRLTPKIPGALILSPVGIGLGYIASTQHLPFSLATLGSTYGSIHFTLFQPPQLEFSFSLFVTGAAIALVAILETMLSAKVADVLTHTKHAERKEMLGLGLANIASGLAGGIPATAALARTALNIRTGATDKISATFASVFLAAISFFLLAYFSYIPMVVIAAILVFVAMQMVEKEHFIKLYRYQRSGFWLSLLVAGLTFYKDPIIGILFGAAASLLLFIEKLSHGQFDIKLNTFDEGLVQTLSGDQLSGIRGNADILVYSIKGKLAYINSRAHVDRFERNLAACKIIVLRLRSVYFIDLDGAEALDEILHTALTRGQKICMTSLNGTVAGMLEQVSSAYRMLKAEGLIFTKSEEALRHFGVKHLETYPLRMPTPPTPDNGGKMNREDFLQEAERHFEKVKEELVHLHVTPCIHDISTEELLAWSDTERKEMLKKLKEAASRSETLMNEAQKQRTALWEQADALPADKSLPTNGYFKAIHADLKTYTEALAQLQNSPTRRQ